MFHSGYLVKPCLDSTITAIKFLIIKKNICDCGFKPKFIKIVKYKNLFVELCRIELKVRFENLYRAFNYYL